MADLKISALTASTTPLAGTEVLPIVQSGTTKQVSVANLTAGRAPSMSGATLRNTAPVLNFVTTAGEDITGYVSNAIDVGSGGKLIFGTKRNGDTALDRVSINAAGDMTLITSNLVVGTSGKGIDFSATSGTGTSELLADYEEGTWTPVGTWTTQGSGTSSGNAYYTKVGRTVTLLMYITATKGTASGDFSITGVPYAPATAAACAVRIAGMGALTKYVGVNISSTTMGFLLQDQATTYGTNATAAEMANDCYIQVTCTYNI